MEQQILFPSRRKYCKFEWSGYCQPDTHIVLDKGTVGFGSTSFVSKCRVEETETELIISIMEETDPETLKKVLEAFERHCNDMGQILHENFLGRINSYPAPVPELVKQLEETPFLDADNSDAQRIIPVALNNDGEYIIDTKLTQYRMVDNSSKLTVGAFLYAFPMQNAVEIVEVSGFAHSVTGEFYALCKTAYIYPQDSAEIQKAFPDFYKTQCLFDNERRLQEFIGTPENLSFIPKDSKIGEKVVYQELVTSTAGYGITSDIFQFALNGGNGSFKDCHQTSGAFITVERGTILGTLIEVDERFKIIFYKCADVVKYKKKLYVKFTYDDESAFFDSFGKAGKDGFKKFQHRDACRSVEYLLCREKITPVHISKKQYENFLTEQ